ncbi:MAG TPA: hypothetical protein VFG64_12955 [Dongiaceae bacterium]|nr:hypothetical protein [Dongiaceae bacterium]
MPILETEATQPVNVYSRTNAAGADADGDIGEAHGPETHLVPLVIQAGLRSEMGGRQERHRQHCRIRSPLAP